MRVIDADALKKAIIKKLGIKSEKYLLESERSIYNCIDEQPTIELLKEQQPKWIPAEERLPGNYEEVLIFDKKWGVLIGWHMTWTKSSGWSTTEAKKVTEITHWMPFPEPPKAGEGG